MGYWVFALVLLFLLQDVWQSANQIQTVPYSEFEKALADGRISDITLTDRTISGHLKAPANGKTLMAAALVEPALAERLNAYKLHQWQQHRLSRQPLLKDAHFQRLSHRSQQERYQRLYFL